MDSSDGRRLSVSLVDVGDGHEAEFVKLSTHLEAILIRKEYGRIEMIRDEASPQRYYAVRYWTDATAAERCHRDPEVQALTAKLYQVARVTHVVNGVRRGLVAAARRAREHADAAFSHFKVGAALETGDGNVITGCNIENATYGLTICAERVAMFKALSEGHRVFTRIAIVADTESPTPPCGACRQILWEFGGNLEIELANLREAKGKHQLQNLLPLPFDARLL